jgi:hypothetical protein
MTFELIQNFELINFFIIFIKTKIGDNLRGIDAKFTIKSERISEK